MDTIEISKPKGYVPLYFDTRDERIINYMIRNIRHHELVNETTLDENIEPSHEDELGKELLRNFLDPLFWREFLAVLFFAGIVLAIWSMVAA